MARFVLILILAAMVANAARAFDCFDFDDVLQVQGQATIDQVHPADLEVVGDAAYSIGEDSAFVAVYDLSDPTQPVELAALPLPAIPTSLAANDDWLLVTVPGLGLVRYDLADPFAPTADDTLDLGVDLPAVALDGDLAVVSIVSGVRTIAFDYPFGMVALGSFASISAVRDVAIDGARLYLATYADGLVVVDATDPGQLLPAGAAAFPGVPDRVDADQGLAVLTGIAGGGSGFSASAYDVGNDSSPAILASTSVSIGYYFNVEPTVTGPDRIVVASRGIGIFDFVVGPSEFEQVGFLRGKHADIHQDASRVVILSESELAIGLPGLFPPAPAWTSGAGQQMIEDDDYIFSTNAGNLRVVQVDAPFGPEQIGSRTLGNPVAPRLSMALQDWALYIGDTYARIDIVSVYNLRQPLHVAYRNLPANPTGMVADDGVLYVLMQGLGIATYDLADPEAPQLIATFDLPMGAYRGAVKLGDQLLVGTESYGVDIFDVSDPADVTLADNLPGRYYISDLALAGDRVLVTDRTQSTQVWQGDAGEWTLLGTVPAARILDLAVGGNVAYLRGEFGDVVMLDLRSPGVPEIVATLPTSYVSDGGIIAGDDWVSVRWGPDHRIYPGPCLLDVTAAPLTPAAPVLALEAAPNPFNPRTRLSFVLDRPGDVQVRVYDLRGRLVDTLIDEPLAAGAHHVDWRGVDRDGRPLPSGVYHARLTAAGAAVSRKISLLK